MKSNTSSDKPQDQTNTSCSDFLYTKKGPIAKMKGIWYSVNGSAEDIMDVRYALKEQELFEFGVTNELLP